MKFNPLILCSAAAITLSAISILSAAARYYNGRRDTVLLFCNLQFNDWSCYDKVIRRIEAAKTSINIAMPSMRNLAIQSTIIKVIKAKNVKVRILIDHDGLNESSYIFLKGLSEAGAEIKCSKGNIQHKFCIIDDKLLMTGTLDWGDDDRLCDLWSYVYVTKKSELVESVKREFFQMWGCDTDLVEEVSLVRESVSSNDNATEVMRDNVDDDPNHWVQSQFDITLRFE